MKANKIRVRKAEERDLLAIQMIYNQGIEDRIATLEADQKEEAYMKDWFDKHQGRYSVLVSEKDGIVVGWATINPYSSRCAYEGVGDISIYIHRTHRGKGIGSKLLEELEQWGREQRFHKLVLFTFPFNRLGQGLYRKAQYREVGVFENQGCLDGKFVNVMVMEKLL